MNIEDDDIAANAEKAFFSPSVTLLQRIERWVKYFEGIFIIIVFLVLSGWQFDIEFLKRPFLHTATMSLVMAFAIFPRYFLFYFLYRKTVEVQKCQCFYFLKENWITR